MLAGASLLGCGANSTPEAAEPGTSGPVEPASSPGAAEPDVQALEETWRAGGEGKWEAWKQLRQIYLEQQRVDDILAGTRRAVEEGSPDWTDYLNYGNMLLAENKEAEALEVYEAGLELEPDAFQLVTGKGTVFLVRDQKEQAFAAFEHALELAPSEPDKQDMHFMLGRLLHEEGRFDDAKVHYQALDAGTIAANIDKVCELLETAQHVEPGTAMPHSFVFIRSALLRQSAGAAEFYLRTSNVSEAEKLLSRLIRCGVPRKEVEALFDLAELIREHKLEL